MLLVPETFRPGLLIMWALFFLYGLWSVLGGDERFGYATMVIALSGMLSASWPLTSRLARRTVTRLLGRSDAFRSAKDAASAGPGFRGCLDGLLGEEVSPVRRDDEEESAAGEH